MEEMTSALSRAELLDTTGWDETANEVSAVIGSLPVITSLFQTLIPAVMSTMGSDQDSKK